MHNFGSVIAGATKSVKPKGAGRLDAIHELHVELGGRDAEILTDLDSVLATFEGTDAKIEGEIDRILARFDETAAWVETQIVSIDSHFGVPTDRGDEAPAAHLTPERRAKIESLIAMIPVNRGAALKSIRDELDV